MTQFQVMASPDGPARSHTLHTTLGWTSLGNWSAWCRDLYLTTHITHKRQTTVPQRYSNSQSQQASSRRPMPHKLTVC